MKLGAMPCRAQVKVQSSDKLGPLEEGTVNRSSLLAKRTHNGMKRQKDMTPEDESLRSEGVPYATGQEWRAITNSSKKTEMAGKKRKRRSAGRIWL